ncbi:SseB family protein [Streptomyces sp. NPDC004667]|uniref:SseB family protein n=1 Tax=Streptomyces sp. NPDC004667 TaxID=3154285 RepID=UPI0033AD38D8
MGFDEEWAQLRAAAAARAASPPAEAPKPAGAPAPAGVRTDPRDVAHEAAGARAAEFRGRVVLVPLDERGGLWTAELGGLDWICAFSDEDALARFAEARGEAEREWPYRRVAGARLLDEVVPALDFPCGAALDAAGPDGAVFPPVRGIVPDAVALDGEVAV